MEQKYILSLDQGTSSSRAIIFDKKGNIVSLAQEEFRQIYPKPGWVEHDPMDILNSQLRVMKECIRKASITPDQIASIGITNQRETAILWDRRTGKPVCNAIVWQDRRTAEMCDRIKEEGYNETIRNKTGLVVDAYFSGTKLRWMLDHAGGAHKLATSGYLAFGTVDSWLVWNLTGGKVHATDVTNASRTMLYNIRNLSWDPDLLELLQIPENVLPEVKSSSEIFGYLDRRFFDTEIPISGIAGDQQAALFGQLCISPGMVKNTYGTGCFLVLNTGDKIIQSENQLLSTIAWQLNGKTTYALEGSIFIAGAIIQWIRDGLGLINLTGDSEEMASKVPDSGGVVLVPALTGLGAPHWDQFARGSLFGLTRGTTKEHIVRAALESICYQVYDVIQAMENDTGVKLAELRVDGGAVNNRLLLQIQSDILNCKVIRPKILETTALGAAYLAGLSVGYWESLDDLKEQWKMESEYLPQISASKREHMIEQWKKAVDCTIGWTK